MAKTKEVVNVKFGCLVPFKKVPNGMKWSVKVTKENCISCTHCICICRCRYACIYNI